MLRLQKRIDKDKFDFENGWEQTRIMWATLMNVNGNKKSPQDLIKLDRDKVSEPVLMSPEEVEKLFAKTINIPDGK